MDAGEKVWRVSLVFAGFAVLFMAENIFGPFRVSSANEFLAVELGSLGIAMALSWWSSEHCTPSMPHETVSGWPHDPDPTEALTRPMADPYATHPYDPQADIPTQISKRDHFLDELPELPRSLNDLPPSVRLPDNWDDPRYWHS